MEEIKVNLQAGNEGEEVPTPYVGGLVVGVACGAICLGALCGVACAS